MKSANTTIVAQRLTTAQRELARLRHRQLTLARTGQVIESAQVAAQARQLREETTRELEADPADCCC